MQQRNTQIFRRRTRQLAISDRNSSLGPSNPHQAAILDASNQPRFAGRLMQYSIAGSDIHAANPTNLAIVSASSVICANLNTSSRGNHRHPAQFQFSRTGTGVARSPVAHVRQGWDMRWGISPVAC